MTVGDVEVEENVTINWFRIFKELGWDMKIYDRITKGEIIYSETLNTEHAKDIVL